MRENPLFGRAPLGGAGWSSGGQSFAPTAPRSSWRGDLHGTVGTVPAGVVRRGRAADATLAPRWTRFNLGEARVVLAGSASALRDAVRSVLLELRFREIAVFETVDAVASHLALAPVDLLIADVELANGDVCEMVRAMRHGERAGDPFLPIVLMTWEPTSDTVRRVTDAGADALIALPMSRERLLDAIEGLISRRKPFVVTTDYIGPDRRTSPRPGSQEIPLLNVPNPLRAKATGRDDGQEHEACLSMINEQKVERHAFQVGYLVRQIVAEYGDGEPERERVAALTRRLQRVTSDLCRRIETTRYAHQAALCRSLLAMVQGFGTGGEVAARDLELLPQLALALQVGFSNDNETVAAANGIVDTLEHRPRQAAEAG